MRNSTYGFGQALWRSWFSKELYKDVGLKWHGSGFAYLLFLLFLCVLVICIIANIYLRPALDGIQKNYAPQIPTMTFSQGKMSIDDNAIHTIKSSSGSTLVIFDPTGQYNEKNMGNAAIVFTPNTMFVTEEEGSVSIHNYPTTLDVTVTPDTVKSLLAHIKRWGIVAIGLGLLISAYIYRILLSLVYSVFGLVFAKISRSHLVYASVLRVSVVAQTPVIILSTLGAILGVYIAHAWIAGVIINLCYIMYGIRAVGGSSTTATDETKSSSDPNIPGP